MPSSRTSSGSDNESMADNDLSFSAMDGVSRHEQYVRYVQQQPTTPPSQFIGASLSNKSNNRIIYTSNVSSQFEQHSIYPSSCYQFKNSSIIPSIMSPANGNLQQQSFYQDNNNPNGYVYRTYSYMPSYYNKQLKNYQQQQQQQQQIFYQQQMLQQQQQPQYSRGVAGGGKVNPNFDPRGEQFFYSTNTLNPRNPDFRYLPPIQQQQQQQLQLQHPHQQQLNAFIATGEMTRKVYEPTNQLPFAFDVSRNEFIEQKKIFTIEKGCQPFVGGGHHFLGSQNHLESNQLSRSQTHLNQNVNYDASAAQTTGTLSKENRNNNEEASSSSNKSKSEMTNLAMAPWNRPMLGGMANPNVMNSNQKLNNLPPFYEPSPFMRQTRRNVFGSAGATNQPEPKKYKKFTKVASIVTVISIILTLIILGVVFLIVLPSYNKSKETSVARMIDISTNETIFNLTNSSNVTKLSAIEFPKVAPISSTTTFETLTQNVTALTIETVPISNNSNSIVSTTPVSSKLIESLSTTAAATTTTTTTFTTTPQVVPEIVENTTTKATTSTTTEPTTAEPTTAEPTTAEPTTAEPTTTTTTKKPEVVTIVTNKPIIANKPESQFVDVFKNKFRKTFMNFY